MVTAQSWLRRSHAYAYTKETVYVQFISVILARMKTSVLGMSVQSDSHKSYGVIIDIQGYVTAIDVYLRLSQWYLVLRFLVL
jgi:hypothetical protein